MRYRAELIAVLTHDDVRMQALRLVRSLGLPDGWIGAGFVRDAVWDRLHGYGVRPPAHDIDVVWFDPHGPGVERDSELERRLCRDARGFAWSVKNQARMHLRNGDAAYGSVAEAMRHWPETATAVAVRLDEDDRLAINAPLGLDDLFDLKLRPPSTYPATRQAVFVDRVARKRWLERYPRLHVVSG